MINQYKLSRMAEICIRKLRRGNRIQYLIVNCTGRQDSKLPTPLSCVVIQQLLHSHRGGGSARRKRNVPCVRGVRNARTVTGKRGTLGSRAPSEVRRARVPGRSWQPPRWRRAGFSALAACVTNGGWRATALGPSHPRTSGGAGFRRRTPLKPRGCARARPVRWASSEVRV